jgi:hypothetical protein
VIAKVLPKPHALKHFTDVMQEHFPETKGWRSGLWLLHSRNMAESALIEAVDASTSRTISITISAGADKRRGVHLLRMVAMKQRSGTSRGGEWSRRIKQRRYVAQNLRHLPYRREVIGDPDTSADSEKDTENTAEA